MTREQWNELAARCESAKGPDREIDLAIARIRNVVVMRRNADDTGNEEHTYWNVTESLDAITSLIERELPGWYWRIQLCGVSVEAWVAPDLNNPLCDQRFRDAPKIWHDYYERNEVEIRPGSLRAAPLVLCAAFCRAMGEKAGE